MDANTVRRRKAAKNTQSRETESYDTSSRKTGELFSRAIILLCAVLMSVLCYGYLTSPLSSISIVDNHKIPSWAKQSNKDLERGVRFLDDLIAPESISIDDSGNLYTGLVDGRIVKIINFGEPEQTVVDITQNVAYTAGGDRSTRRVFGIRYFANKLYVADSFQGVFSIDLTSLQWQNIVGYKDTTPPLMLPNDLAITKNGRTLYFVDSSARWTFSEAAWMITEGDCSGRIIKVDLETNQFRVWKDNLCLPNGLELSADESKILVSEFARKRISVFNVATSEKVNTILLPGGSDNIRRSVSGGYWAPIAAFGGPQWFYTEKFPVVRDIMGGLISHDYLFYLTVARFSTSGAAVKISKDFAVQSIHFDKSGKHCSAMSEFHEYAEGKFIVGSYAAAGLVKLEWPDRR